MAALSYEVVWIRVLSLILSITVYSLTTVLCAFMAGLGVGSVIGAAVADRVKRPLVIFGWVELGIAASGLAIPAALFNMAPVYLWVYEFFGGQGVAFGSARFLLAFAVLLVPSTLMGVTLPLLSRAVIDREGVAGRGAGGLYAANTLGAVAGWRAGGLRPDSVPGASLHQRDRRDHQLPRRRDGDSHGSLARGRGQPARG